MGDTSYSTLEEYRTLPHIFDYSITLKLFSGSTEQAIEAAKFYSRG
ncbi:hypothetical protein R9C00_01300 [Flammeovirgaceae bacterium SG7u.111]|nr:hypothetical protein [Flammeovirgaceae bacterium SG7u.132]WPO36084.1 hypothetical protein R9C00_01300 [Flammeovirgaceae bacterium SG7u.111]